MPIAATAIVAAVSAVSDVAEAVQKVGVMLDGARTMVLTLENYTEYSLEKISDNHQHGGFGVTPVHVLEPRQTEVFGAKDTGFMTGVKGSLRYRINGITPETFVEVTYQNPFVGSNAAGAFAYTLQDMVLPMPPPGKPVTMKVPSRSTRFRTTTTCGGGDKDVEVRYTLQKA
jgi:hypothetical protein